MNEVTVVITLRNGFTSSCFSVNEEVAENAMNHRRRCKFGKFLHLKERFQYSAGTCKTRMSP